MPTRHALYVLIDERGEHLGLQEGGEEGEVGLHLFRQKRHLDKKLYIEQGLVCFGSAHIIMRIRIQEYGPGGKVSIIILKNQGPIV